MKNVVALQRPSITDAAHAIAIKFAQADKAEERASALRIEIGFDLLRLRKRVEDGEAGEDVEWWHWIKQYCNRTRRDMRRCIAIAEAEDPEAALEQERAKTRTQRERKKSQPQGGTSMSHLAVADLIVARAVQAVAALMDQMTREQRRQFVAQLKEEYPW